MASFVEIKKADGLVKIKAVCRVLRDKKQITKCKTFGTLEEAEAWAVETEKTMKLALDIEKRMGIWGESQLETFDDLIMKYSVAIENIKYMEKIPLLVMRSEIIENYFLQRKNEGASKEEMGIEAELLYLMFSSRDKATGKHETNIIQRAITELNRKGVIN